MANLAANSLQPATPVSSNAGINTTPEVVNESPLEECWVKTIYRAIHGAECKVDEEFAGGWQE